MANQAFYLGKLAPEIIELVQRRYEIIRTINYMQPIGRRVLAEKLKLGERTVRNDVEILREQELIDTDAKGMTITHMGEKVLEELAHLLRSIRGIDQLEKYLASALKVKKVIIVPGNIDEDPFAKEELGRVAAAYLQKIIKNIQTMAVAGGTTLAEVANHIYGEKRGDLLVLPARGGLGEQVEIQANSIAAKIANNLQAHYRLLHVPDFLCKSSSQELLKDPHVAPIIELIKNTDVLVHGIGDSLVMAKRRGISWDEIEKIKSRGGQGETFGYYFNGQGEIIHTTPSIGLNLADLGKIKQVIAIAGGTSKVKAIQSVAKAGFINSLIIDEGAARRIVDDFKKVGRLHDE